MRDPRGGWCRSWGLFACLLQAIASAPVSAVCDPLPATAPIPDVRLKPFVDGLDFPLQVTHAGSGRLFVVEQAGRILEIRNRRVVTPPFLDVRDRVDFAPGSEKGLLAIAFHPRFAENGRVFVHYNGISRGQLQTFISEFMASPDRSSASSASELVILKLKQPFENHNGGQIAFGPDGFLYIGLGDGGGGNDPFGNAQNLAQRLGKILRIDVDRTGARRAFAIPPDNPFAGVAGAHPTIFALGFRNPFRFSFDTATGELYAGDVGESAREEIDLVRAGGNYGWNPLEGTLCTPRVSPPDCDRSGFEPPIAEYGRDDGCSVIGGFVYRGDKIPALCGVYLYSDFCSGTVWGLRQSGGRVTAGPRVVLESRLSVSSFGANRRGELFILDLGGEVFKIGP